MPEQPLGERFSRYAMTLPLIYRLAGAPHQKSRAGWTRDLSERGAWLELPELLPQETRLEIRVRAPESTVEVGARVVWLRNGPAGDGVFLHGVAFTGVTPAQSHALRDLFARQKQRATARAYLALSVRCWRKGERGDPVVGQTRDLSRGGTSLRLVEPMPPGTPLDMTFPTALGPVTLEGVIVWAESEEPRPRGALYRHGVRFLRAEMASGVPLSALQALLR